MYPLDKNICPASGLHLFAENEYCITGIIKSTPLKTEYDSRYGPPVLAQLPTEMTHLGSGIIS
jgi:hypothetical protein